MAVSGDTNGRATSVLAKTGEILRALNPPTVASLLLLFEDATYTQKEVADRIGSSRSSVSQYQQSLGTLSLPLATKQGYRYRITPAGEALVAHLNGMADRLGVDLHSLDWQSETAHEKVASLLTPLYDSRSTMPFFVLESVGTRSGVEDRIDSLSTPQQVWIEDVIQDVQTRQQERGASSTSAQVRQMVRRFDEKDAIEIDDNRITLTKKGQEHAVLLEQVARLVEEQSDSIEDEEESEQTATTSGGASYPDATDSDQTGVDERSTRPENIANQVYPHGFRGQLSSEFERQETDEREGAVPVFCLRPNVGEGINGASSSEEHPTPVMAFEASTVGEFVECAQQLAHEYDMDTQLEPYWMIRAESELYPMGSMDDLPSDSSGP